MRDKTATVAFGTVIKTLRLERKLTQDLLAEKSGTERSHISDLERGIKGPAISTIFNMARALNILPGDLINLVGDELARQMSKND